MGNSSRRETALASLSLPELALFRRQRRVALLFEQCRDGDDLVRHASLADLDTMSPTNHGFDELYFHHR